MVIGADRGYDRGRRDARLDNHDGLFKRLEVSLLMSYVGAALGFAWLGLSTQRLGDGARASAATAIALAQALKEEKDTARDTLATENTTSQSKWGKTNTVIAALSFIVTVLGSVYLVTR